MPTEAGGYFAQLQKENELVEDTQNKLRTAQRPPYYAGRQLRVTRWSRSGNSLSLGSATLRGSSSLRPGCWNACGFPSSRRHRDPATLEELKRRRAAGDRELRRGDAGAAAPAGRARAPSTGIALALKPGGSGHLGLDSELTDHRAKAQELRKMLNTRRR